MQPFQCATSIIRLIRFINRITERVTFRIWHTKERESIMRSIQSKLKCFSVAVSTSIIWSCFDVHITTKKSHFTCVQDWTQVLFNQFFILVGLFEIFILHHIWQNCVCFDDFLPMRHFVMLIITKSNLSCTNLIDFDSRRLDINQVSKS